MRVLPVPGSLLDMFRAARGSLGFGAAFLSLVRDGSCRLAVPDMWELPVPLSNRRCPPYGRGARPRLPRIPVRTSGGSTVLDAIGPEPALVVATPGAEPQPAPEQYAAALLLDAWALLSRPDLRAGEEALRRWLAAAALVRPGSAGGRVVILADSGLAAVQALVRTDPDGFAQRELSERAALAFPPAARLAAVEGSAADVENLLAATTLPAVAHVLGPVLLAGHAADPAMSRALVRVPRADGLRLAAALQAAQGVRSARKAGGSVRVVIDPITLG